MKRGKIKFNGSFGEFFVISLLLIFLSIATFGILLPYYLYWQVKYFVSNLSIELYDSPQENNVDKK